MVMSDVNCDWNVAASSPRIVQLRKESMAPLHGSLLT